MRTGILYAALAYAAWGLLAPVGDRLLQDFEPFTLNAVRMVLATAVLLPIVGRKRTLAGLRLLRDWRIAGLVVLGGGVDFTLYLYALQRVDPAWSALGFYTAPLWTALVARFVLGERAGWMFLPAAAGMLLGGALAVSPDGGLPRPDSLGLLLAVATGFGWALYAVGLRKVAPGIALRPLVVASFVAAAAYFLVGMLVLEGLPNLGHVGAGAWGWMALYVAGPTTLSLFLYNGALQRVSASTVNLLVGLEVAFTLVFDAWFFGATFGPRAIAGVGLILASVSGYLYLQARPTRLPSVPGSP